MFPFPSGWGERGRPVAQHGTLNLPKLIIIVTICDLFPKLAYAMCLALPQRASYRLRLSFIVAVAQHIGQSATLRCSLFPAATSYQTFTVG